MKIRVLFLLFVLVLNRTTWATNVTIDGSHISVSDKEKDIVDLNRNFRFAIGDNLEWAKPGFDYSKWDTAYFPFSIDALMPFGFKGNVWFRSTFNITPELASKPLSFIVYQYGASEIYIDGKLIHQFGKVSTALTNEERFNPQSSPVTFKVDSVGLHSIAIRYSNHANLDMENGAIELDAFDLNIVDGDSGVYINKLKVLKQYILTAIGIGIFLTLSIINFILFLFYKRDKANLYYSIFSIAVAITFVLSALEYNCDEASSEFILNKLNTVFLFISNIFLVALVYSFIYQKNIKRFWILVSITCAGILITFYEYDLGKMISTVLGIYCAIEIVIIVLKAYFEKYDPTKKKRKIMWTVLATMGVIACLGLFINKVISLVIFIILVLIFVVPIAGIIFIVPLYMTVRHAKSFAVTNHNLEEQLKHVKELSAKTLEQEQEKKRILETQNERLEHLVNERTAELAEKNNEIKDSINYAQRIQKAMLTSKQEINATLQECFVLFKPKDIVSGDFYFFDKKDNTALIAAADCTGHGVPGALMSMIGVEKMMGTTNESVNPSVILNLLNKGIKSSLRQSEHEESTRDGMDIALVALNLETYEASYAGANRPIWIIRNGQKEVEEIKATKKAIGGFTPDEQHYELHSIKLNKGDAFYLFTDGYADQFSNHGKKLMTKKFREILLNIQHLNMNEQEQYLNNFIEDWKNGVEQVDDILVIGVRV